MRTETPALPADPPVLATPPAAPPLAPVSADPSIAIAAPAKRRFRVARAYAAALRVALSYLGFDLARRVRGPRWAARRKPALHARNGRRVRESILRLRGLFIKAGQLASVLTNLLPEPFRAELEGLQDRVPASPPEAARARIEAELGAPIEALFASFEKLPVASASLAQVHRARLAAGVGGDGLAKVREVAVKVQHADIDAIARLDLHAIETILRVVGRWFGVRGLREQFLEIEDVILGELDFVREAESGTEIAQNLGAGLSVPAVIPERSSRRVLTTDFVDGIKAGDLAALDAAGIDRMALAERILDAYGGMIFRDGLYHADPHPGNLLVRPDPAMPDGFELVFLDFGAVARLSPAMQTGLAEMIVGVLGRDTPRVMAALGTMGFVSDGDPDQATAAVMQFMESAHEELFHNLDPRAFRLGDLSFEMALSQKKDMFRQMGDVGISVRDLAAAFRVPRDWILMERTALLLIGLCGGLAPDINPLTVLEPHIRPLTRQATASVGTALWADVLSAGRVLLGLPTRVDRVLATAEASGLPVSDPAVAAATERLARSVRGLAYSVGAVGAGGIAYAAFASGHGQIALALAAVAALFGIGTLRAGRR